MLIIVCRDCVGQVSTSKIVPGTYGSFQIYALPVNLLFVWITACTELGNSRLSGRFVPSPRQDACVFVVSTEDVSVDYACSCLTFVERIT